MPLLFCWRRDQNSTFFGAWIIVRMLPTCLTFLPHLPRPLESSCNLPGSCFRCQKNTSALRLENVLLCRCALSPGGWSSPRLNAPRVSCMTASFLGPLGNGEFWLRCCSVYSWGGRFSCFGGQCRRAALQIAYRHLWTLGTYGDSSV